MVDTAVTGDDLHDQRSAGDWASGDWGFGESISDEELTQLALAADPDVALDDDAVALSSLTNPFPSLLPDWYMPAPASFDRRRRRGLVAVTFVAALLLVNALGLCATYGHLELAW